MNQYRVSLWIENQGDVPDVDVQFQVVGVVAQTDALRMGELVIAAFFLARRHVARLVVIEALDGGRWLEISRASRVKMNGSSEIWLNSSRVL
jgi:hypothetical protein